MSTPQAPSNRTGLPQRLRLFGEGLLVGVAPYLIFVPISWRPANPIADNLFQVLVMWSWVVFGWLVLKLRGETLRDIGVDFSRSIVRTVGLGVLIGLCIFTASQLRDAIGAKPNLSVFAEMHGNLPLTLSFMAVGFLGAGISEEFVYRGVAMNSFARAFGDGRWSWPLAAVLQAGLFAIGHIYMGLPGIIWSFLLGVGVAAAYLATRRNLIAAMIGHGLHNVLKMVLFYWLGSAR